MNYAHHRWAAVYLERLQEGLREKFVQSQVARQALLNVQADKIVYASRGDRVLGTGLVLSDANNQDEAEWQGLNELGKALATIRRDLTH